MKIHSKKDGSTASPKPSLTASLRKLLTALEAQDPSAKMQKLKISLLQHQLKVFEEMYEHGHPTDAIELHQFGNDLLNDFSIQLNPEDMYDVAARAFRLAALVAEHTALILYKSPQEDEYSNTMRAQLYKRLINEALASAEISLHCMQQCKFGAERFRISALLLCCKIEFRKS